MGSDYSIADPYLFTLTQWLPLHQIDSSRFPNIHTHKNQMLERPAVQQAIAAEEAASN